MTEKFLIRMIGVLALAKRIVCEPPTEFGYSDIGDVLVRTLRGDIGIRQAKIELTNLEKDYERKR